MAAGIHADHEKVNGIESFHHTVVTAIEKLLVVLKPISPSAGCSKKMHLPLHWADYIKEIGCSANEKTQEKAIGDMWKKRFKHTGGRIDDRIAQVHTNINFDKFQHQF